MFTWLKEKLAQKKKKSRSKMAAQKYLLKKKARSKMLAQCSTKLSSGHRLSKMAVLQNTCRLVDFLFNLFHRPVLFLA